MADFYPVITRLGYSLYYPYLAGGQGDKMANVFLLGHWLGSIDLSQDGLAFWAVYGYKTCCLKTKVE